MKVIYYIKLRIKEKKKNYIYLKSKRLKLNSSIQVRSHFITQYLMQFISSFIITFAYIFFNLYSKNIYI